MLEIRNAAKIRSGRDAQENAKILELAKTLFMVIVYVRSLNRRFRCAFAKMAFTFWTECASREMSVKWELGCLATGQSGPIVQSRAERGRDRKLEFVSDRDRVNRTRIWSKKRPVMPECVVCIIRIFFFKFFPKK